MKKYILFICFISITCVAFVGNLDKKDQQRDEVFYCEMVDLWEFDKEAGISDNHRRGWPNYKKLDC